MIVSSAAILIDRDMSVVSQFSGDRGSFCGFGATLEGAMSPVSRDWTDGNGQNKRCVPVKVPEPTPRTEIRAGGRFPDKICDMCKPFALRLVATFNCNATDRIRSYVEIHSCVCVTVRYVQFT